MKANETVEQFVKRAMTEVVVDVDVNYCVKNGIKYDNHEVDASKVKLFTKESMKAAFDFVEKNR